MMPTNACPMHGGFITSVWLGRAIRRVDRSTSRHSPRRCSHWNYDRDGNLEAAAGKGERLSVIAARRRDDTGSPARQAFADFDRHVPAHPSARGVVSTRQEAYSIALDSGPIIGSIRS